MNGFSAHSVRTILHFESTVGTLAAFRRSNRPAILSYYEPAANVAIFDKAQEILLKSRIDRAPASNNPITTSLLKGIIRCQCGASVHPTGAKATYQGVYRRSNAPDGRYNAPAIKRKPFDKWMPDNIVGFLERDDSNNTDKRKAEIEYQVPSVASKLKKTTTLLLGLDDVTELKGQVKELGIQRSSL